MLIAHTRLLEAILEAILVSFVRDPDLVPRRSYLLLHYLTYSTRSVIAALWIIFPNVALQRLQPALDF